MYHYLGRIIFFDLCGGHSGHSSDKHAQTNMDPSIVAVEKAIQEMISANVEERTVHESKERWFSLWQCLRVFQVTLFLPPVVKRFQEDEAIQ